jgi:hypothetical protein
MLAGRLRESAEARGNLDGQAYAVVVPEPAGTLTGEKTAAAPAGRPLADSAIAFGKDAGPVRRADGEALPGRFHPAAPSPRCSAPLATPMVKSVAAGRVDNHRVALAAGARYGVPALLSVAVMVQGKEPAAAGVPDSTPAALRVNPVGNAPLLTE